MHVYIHTHSELSYFILIHNLKYTRVSECKTIRPNVPTKPEKGQGLRPDQDRAIWSSSSRRILFRASSHLSHCSRTADLHREKEFSENMLKPHVENMSLKLYSLILPVTEDRVHCQRTATLLVRPLGNQTSPSQSRATRQLCLAVVSLVSSHLWAASHCHDAPSTTLRV